MKNIYAQFALLVMVLLAACSSPAEEIIDLEPVPNTSERARIESHPSEEPAAVPTTAPTAEPVATAEPEPSPTPAGNLMEVQPAVVRIVAEGSFVDPDQGTQLNVSGSGSGFIISPDGLAVTNNHVVTGAAILRVYIQGEREPRNARVLGVSECSDLALIDIDGDDFSFLQWYDGDITVGQEVYAAGYPLGESEFTLTRGIVSKASTSGETEWASVDSVMEHDATLNRGNSGGPLITREGQVIGVNFAGNFERSQYFAIGRSEVERVLDTLRQEENVNSIGINGMALSDAEGGLGIWVFSVESGSPADRVGVKGGDLIISLEGLTLAVDGTLSDYCDVLRSREMDDVLSIEVLRFTDGGTELLKGRINGSELEVTDVFGGQADGGTQAAPPADSAIVQDATGTLEAIVPAGWEVRTQAPDSDLYSAQLVAAPQLSLIDDSWAGYGISIAFTDNRDISVDALLDYYNGLYSAVCDYDGREPYDDGQLIGQYEFFANCEGTTAIGVLALTTPNSDYHLLIQLQYLNDAQLDEVIAIFNNFVINR